MNFVPATAELVARYYAEGWKKGSMYALAVQDGDTLLGLVGIYRDAAGWVMFSDGDRDRVTSPRFKVQMMKRLLAIADQYHLTPLYAVADEHIESAGRFLEHYGFVRDEGSIYRRESWPQPSHI